MTYFQSVNFPFDSVGEEDPRPGCWGKAGYCDVLVPFLGVPEGKRVRLVSFHGDCYAYLNGRAIVSAVPGSNCGICCGFITKTSGPLPDGTPGIIDGIKFIGGFDDGSPLAKARPATQIDPRAGAYDDCNVYLCDSIGYTKANTRIAIDRTDLQGVLDEHHCLLMRQAFFLNDTSLPVHMEITGVIEYEYVDA